MYDSIPLCRSIFKHWVYQDAEYLKVWVTMLGRAKYTFGIEKKIYNGVIYEIDRGQFVFGRPSWVEYCGISESRLKTLLRKLIAEDMIKIIKQYPKFTIYQIINYEKFNQQDNQQNDQQEDKTNQELQGFDDQQDNQQSVQQMTSKCPADDQQVSNNKESKESKKGKQGKKDIYIEQFENLWNIYPNKKGRDVAFKKTPNLIKEFGFDQIKRCIERYVQEIEAKGTKKEFIKHGSTFFNGGYVDYLDLNYKGDVSKNGGYKDDNQPNYSYYDNQEYTGPIYDDSEFI